MSNLLVLKQKLISREDLKANRDVLYLFGDNLMRRGLGGQAKEMRGEINAFGIATKRNPYDYEEGFFEDSSKTIKIIEDEFVRLADHIAKKRISVIVVPMDGLGTGLSQMPERCPAAFKYLCECLEDLPNWPVGDCYGGH